MSKPSHKTEQRAEIIFLTFVYALYILALTAPLGFIISAFKVYRFKKSAESSTAPLPQDAVLIATHYEWLVRTFIFMVILTMAAAGLLYYIVGIVLAGLALIWWFYRLIRGAMALIAYKTMPATICTQALCYGQVESV